MGSHHLAPLFCFRVLFGLLVDAFSSDFLFRFGRNFFLFFVGIEIVWLKDASLDCAQLVLRVRSSRRLNTEKMIKFNANSVGKQIYLKESRWWSWWNSDLL